MQPRTRAGLDLLRLLALWLVAALLLQGLMAAQARGTGPLHRHRDDVSATQPPVALLQHAVAGASQHDGHALAHHHAHGAERHLHGTADLSLLPADDGDGFLDAAAFALAAALALAGADALAWRAAAGRHVWHAAPAWAWRVALMAPPRRPPRAA